MTTDSQFSHTATGVLGLHRSTMLENPLHQRPQIARSFNQCHHVPDNLTFGIKNEKAGAVSDSMYWPTTLDSLLVRQPGTPPRDFVSINKEAVRTGLSSTRELSEFRLTHDIRKKPKSQKKKRDRGSRIPPTTVFGIPSRVSTPIFEVISHKYQQEWLDQSLKSRPTTNSEAGMQRTLQALDTRSSLLKTHIIPLDPVPSWKLEKFDKKAHSQVGTFRSDKERDIAWKKYLTDRIGREGVMRSGIYSTAKY